MRKAEVIPVAIIIMVLSLLTGCGPADSGNEKPALSKTVQANETFQLPENAVVLQSLERDLYGDYTEENVVLYLQKNEKGRPVSLHLVVECAEKVSVGLEEGFVYDTGRLGFEDLDRDKSDEVLLYRCSYGTSSLLTLKLWVKPL